ncbi:MAG: transketolase [Breznakia sp.]
MDVLTLEKKAIELKKEVMQLVYTGKTGHTGSDLSCADILVALYYGVMNIDPQDAKADTRDRYIQSKGHAVEILWVVLADKGFFPKSDLTTFSKYKSIYIGHPNNKVNGVEMNTGSLGHGLPLAVGSAIAAKLDNKEYHTYTLMGDGELAEGSIWEGAMAAAQYKLDNLTAIIDYNKLQISGCVDDVMCTSPLKEKWEAFGWNVVEVKGNDMGELIHALKKKPIKDKPTMIIAHTLKGNGVSDAEDVASWHHHVPTDDELARALCELDQQLEVLNNGK